MGKRKILKRLERDFGKVPDVHYFAGDMENIAAYYDYRRDNKLDDFLLDETTWYDLDMDALFRRINPGLSTCGEQYLYYMLRHPAVSKEDYDQRHAVLAAMEDDPALRLRLQYILGSLGKSRHTVMSQAFNPERRGSGWLILFTCLNIALLVSIVIATFFYHMAVLPAVALIVINTALHTFRVNKLGRDFETVNYSFAMIIALNKIRKLKAPVTDVLMPRAFDSLGRFKSALRMGSIPVFSANDISQVAINIFLLDLIAYEFLKNKFFRNHGDLFTIHEHLGRLDAAIAVASFKESLAHCCAPELNFSGAPAFIEAAGIAHPMLNSPVTNELASAAPILITGSNASGKSTYLKAAALCAILAQSLCVTTALRWHASAFRIFSSMAVTDNLSAGESYFIVEIKSLKRILDAAGDDASASGGPVLAVIDEVLRGTNTVERIAASVEVLRAMAADGILCLAATHDIELCTLLSKQYRLFHFEETVGDGEITFDYTLKPGPAGSRNAIELLRLIGFDDDIVRKAHKRADGYLSTGVWS